MLQVAPGGDEALEHVVGLGQVRAVEALAGDGAGGVAAVEPLLDGAPLVGLPGLERHGVVEHLAGDGAHEVLGRRQRLRRRRGAVSK